MRRRGEKKKKKSRIRITDKGGKMEEVERKKNCVRADNGKERLWLREGREGRKGTVRSRALSGTDQVQPSVVASPSLMTVPVLAAQVLPTRARGSRPVEAPASWALIRGAACLARLFAGDCSRI